MTKIREGEPCRLVLYGQPATKKNSATLRRSDYVTVLPSNAYRKYERHCREQLAELQRQGRSPHYDGPVRIMAHYYLKDVAHWPDLVGLMQATADIISDEYKVINHKRTLVRKWLLSDDRIIKNWDGSHIAGLDKDNPRVEIWIYTLEPKDEADEQLLAKG